MRFWLYERLNSLAKNFRRCFRWRNWCAPLKLHTHAINSRMKALYLRVLILKLAKMQPQFDWSESKTISIEYFMAINTCTLKSVEYDGEIQRKTAQSVIQFANKKHEQGYYDAFKLKLTRATRKRYHPKWTRFDHARQVENKRERFSCENTKTHCFSCEENLDASCWLLIRE